MLTMQAAGVAADLFPAGTRRGHHFHVGSLAGEPGQSLAIHLGGAKPGNWRDFSTAERGDILDLVAQTLFQGNKGEAVAWARRFLGIDHASPRALVVRRREAARKAEAASRQAEGEARRRRNAAMRIYLEASPQILGTPVDLYLRGRGLCLFTPGGGAAFGAEPRTAEKTSGVNHFHAIRFHPDLLVSETGELMPGMVAAITGPKGGFVACHRTFLSPSPQPSPAGGRGSALPVWRKASIKSPKRVLGSFAGGHVSIVKGPSGKPLKDAPEGDAVIITEGIEDALTLALAVPDMRVIAAVSLGNMAGVVIPETIRTRYLLRDRDDSAAARAAFARAVEAHQAQCADVRVIDPPAGAKDVNEFLCRPPEAASPRSSGRHEKETPPDRSPLRCGQMGGER